MRLIGVLALVALNGFFAAAEFSLVAVRLSRVRQLVQKGDTRARKSLRFCWRSCTGSFPACNWDHAYEPGAWRAWREHARKLLQTMWPRAAGTRAALLAHAAALAGAFALLSALHVVIGELVPKTVSLARAERVALLVARPFSWFLNTFRWAIDLLDGISGAIVKALGFRSRKATAPRTPPKSCRFKFNRRANAD